MEILVPISAGELVDKITILRIKVARLEGDKQANTARELAALEAVAAGALPASAELDAAVAELARLNDALWEIEDRIRALEAAGDFGPAFVETARSVYFTNDARFRAKRRVNALVGSDLIEEKSHA